MDVLEVIKKQEREKGKLEGLQEGKHTSMLSIATEMKKEGFPIDKIVQFTKLSATEIELISF